MTTWVKYIGLAHVRMITADEFRRAGFPDQETVVWDYTNGHTVDAGQFSDEVMRRAIETDRDFIVVKSDEDLNRPLEHAMTPGQAASRIQMRDEEPPIGRDMAEQLAQPSGVPDDAEIVSTDATGGSTTGRKPTGGSTRTSKKD